ncbi:metallophosphoesterase [Bacillus sp. JCM 19041]|uniref:metallophosphoesterase n=1 Tax=Bacillus sp. JCM 19041 TaxID=1460637 RepID=UPI0006D217E9
MAKQWIKLMGAFASGALLMHMAKQAHENNVTVHSWSSRSIGGQPEKLRIFFITDIHRRRISEEMLTGIKGECDVILIGGDLTEKWVPKKRTEKNIEKLTEIAPTYFVRGNNDEEVDQAWLAETLKSFGVVYLDDDLQK